MAVAAGFDEATAGKVALAVDEATANVIEHAYHGEAGRELELRIEDRGPNLTVEVVETSVVVVPDRQNLIKRQVTLARGLLLRGSAVEAVAAARCAVKLAEPTDLVPDHANALLMLADALDTRDQRGDATAARREAIGMLQAKGNLVAVALAGG